MATDTALSDQGYAALAPILGIGFLLALLAGYFAPTIVALVRRHPQQWAILAVDLFLGWTIIGWVIALAWSLMRVERSNADVLLAVTLADRDTKPCPSCAERVKVAAVKCRFCGQDLAGARL